MSSLNKGEPLEVQQHVVPGPDHDGVIKKANTSNTNNKLSIVEHTIEKSVPHTWVKYGWRYNRLVL